MTRIHPFTILILVFLLASALGTLFLRGKDVDDAHIPNVNTSEVTPIPNTMTLEASPHVDTNTTTPAVPNILSTTPQTPDTDTSTKTKPVVSTPPLTSDTEIMAWIYPGPPACAAVPELTDGRKIDVVKTEYFRIDEAGSLILITAAEEGCNGYSEANIALLKRYASAHYVTISANYAHAMGIFLDGNTDTAVTTLTNFVIDHNLTGIELDFEDFGGWTPAQYTNYKEFVSKLGTQLHTVNKKLMVDGPAVSNATEEAWYVWRYADFNTLPVDQVVIMAYDYQFDHGAGNPVAPLSWIENVVTWISKSYTSKGKLVVGLPSYGYRGTEGTQSIKLYTYDQMQNEPGFETAERDESSGEMTWKNGSVRYFYQDSVSLTLKRAVVEKLGIRSISVWHLGGNLWFK